jgi:hypothetical protein
LCIAEFFAVIAVVVEAVVATMNREESSLTREGIGIGVEAVTGAVRVERAIGIGALEGVCVSVSVAIEISESKAIFVDAAIAVIVAAIAIIIGLSREDRGVCVVAIPAGARVAHANLERANQCGRSLGPESIHIGVHERQEAGASILSHTCD